ncbi:MAG TPA: hypothetical protein VFL76_03150 [Edaphocola sp.]|nr:hypothetical protein [Edaphocola sp.]
MRYLRYISFLALLASCGTPKPFARAGTVIPAAPEKVLRPAFDKALYRCEVNGRFLFKAFHLSGLLFLRNFGDTTVRVVFQNEMGLTYFDFGWNRLDSFRVFHIIDKMNKPALIRTLQKDFEIILCKNVQSNTVSLVSRKGTVMSRHPFYDGYLYYYRSQDNPSQCFQIDYGTEKKTLVRFGLRPALQMPHPELPDTILIKHYKAGFVIQLHKLRQNNDD